MLAITLSLTLKFIPVRGRKRFKLLDVGERVVEIYPREGAEIKLHGLHLHAVWLKFIPVRGRKRELDRLFEVEHC